MAAKGIEPRQPQIDAILARFEALAGKIPADPRRLVVQVKNTLYAKKDRWHRIQVGRVAEDMARWAPGAFEDGRLALWVTPYAETPEGRALFLWVDIDPLGAEHSDLEAAIDTALALLMALAEAGLDEGLVVLLSGQGFRFCWPIAIEPHRVPALMALIRDAGRFPGIDPSPFSGPPLGLLGYRGSTHQGAKGDIHFHRLPHPSDLVTLEPADYRDMVAGPADLDAAVQIMDAITPRIWTPPAWQAVLAPYEREVAQRRNILREPFQMPRKSNRTVDLEAIDEFLADNGITHHSVETEHGRVELLSECPLCMAEDKSWFNPATGKLKCFRNSCDAGALETGSNGVDYRPGVPLRDWCPDAVIEVVDDEIPATNPAASTTLAEARQLTKAALRADDPAVLIRVAAGAGKTTAAVDAALDRGREGLVLITSPSTKLAEEIFEKAQEMAASTDRDGVEIRMYRGRNAKTCKQYKRCEEVAKKGFLPGVLVCPSCNFLKVCQHRRQMKGLKKGILVAAHAAAPTIFSSVGHKVDTWIVDEDALKTFLRLESVTSGEMQGIAANISGVVTESDHFDEQPISPAAVLHKIEDAARRLLALVPKNGREQGRLYACECPPGEWAHTTSLREAAEISDAEWAALKAAVESSFTPTVRSDGRRESMLTFAKRLEAMGVNMLAVEWLRAALDGRGGYVCCKPDPTSPITYCWLRNSAPTPEDFGGFRVVALDATGDPAELKALFGREFKVVDAAVTPPPGRRVWIQRALGKVKAKGKAENDPRYLVDRLKEAAAHLAAADKKVLIVTHMAVEAAVLEAARKLFPKRTWDATHHGNARGLNAWEHFDAVIALGHLTPPRPAVHDLELAVFGADKAARDQWYSDLGRRDLIQSTARVRPVLTGRTVIVSASIWPWESLGAPTTTIDGRRRGGTKSKTEEAYGRLLPLAKEHGLVFSEMAEVVGVFIEGNEARAAEWVAGHGERGSGSELWSTVINNRALLQSTTITPPSAAALNRRTWVSLIGRIAEELSLPSLLYHSAAGAGRPQPAAGTLAAARRFSLACGRAFDPKLWRGVEDVVAAIPRPTSTELLDRAFRQPSGRRPYIGLVSALPRPIGVIEGSGIFFRQQPAICCAAVA